MHISDMLNAVTDSDLDKVKEFLDKGFPVNLELNLSGWRLLHVAAQAGSEAIIRALLAKGADVDQTDSQEHLTPLMVATTNNQKASVIALLEAGADANIPDVLGRTPLQVAQRLKYKGIYETLTSFSSK
jgi:ankyrin repeat protein